MTRTLNVCTTAPLGFADCPRIANQPNTTMATKTKQADATVNPCGFAFSSTRGDEAVLRGNSIKLASAMFVIFHQLLRNIKKTEPTKQAKAAAWFHFKLSPR